jgi:hypothetical protein
MHAVQSTTSCSWQGRRVGLYFEPPMETYIHTTTYVNRLDLEMERFVQMFRYVSYLRTCLAGLRPSLFFAGARAGAAEL